MSSLMFLMGRQFSLPTQFRFKKYLFSRETIMVLNGANEELMLVPVFAGNDADDFNAVYGSDSCSPAFILSDDDIDDDDEFDDEDEYEDDDLDEEDDDDEDDDDYEEDDYEEDDDYEDEDEEDDDWDDED